MDIDQVKHDFINNSIRIDVLHKIICEAIEENKEFDKKYIQDLEKFLQEQVKHTQNLQPL